MGDNGKLIDLIHAQLAARQPGGYAKLEAALGELDAGFDKRKFFRTFALCPRWFDKQTNDVDAAGQVEWKRLDPYGVLQRWQYPQLARLLILLTVGQSLPQEQYVEAVNELFQTADVSELVMLGRSLAFLPGAELFIDRARENARSNIAPVFSSVAHYNEYALRFFDEGAWNQLVLKAAFLAEPIWSIAGLKQRNNDALVTMLRHYVEERQAANRSVPWDLWCCIGWRARGEQALDDLRHQWSIAPTKAQAAIALALKENSNTDARTTGEELLWDIHEDSDDTLTWPMIAEWPD